MTKWLKEIEENIVRRKLLRRGEAVLVAVSGGVDSIVLLHLLAALATKHHWKLTLAHFNHHLRGLSSDADERLVRKTASAMDLPVEVSGAPAKMFAKEHGLSIEMAARKLRHEFLASAAKHRGIRKIALAHHADDQLELFFLRLFRGAGPEGLAGMKWQSRSPVDGTMHLIRPLLDQPKRALRAYAAEHKLLFREDATNASLDFERNRIRHKLIPLLERDYGPAFPASVLRAMEIIGAESELVGEIAQKRLNRKSSDATVPVAVQRRVLKLRLRALGIEPDFDLVERLRRQPCQWIAVSRNKTVCCDHHGNLKQKRVAALSKPSPDSLGLNVSGPGNCLFGPLAFSWKTERQAGAQFKRQPNTEFFDADNVGDHIQLRHWQPGDRFRPIGMSQAVKLQDLFINAKVPLAERHRRVIAVAEKNVIFWVEGLRISEDFKLESGTRRRLKWSWWKPATEVATNSL